MLEGEVAIDRYEHAELFRSKREQVTVLYSRPSHLARRLDLVSKDVAREPPVDAL